MMETCCFCFQYATRVLILFGVTPFTHWILSAEMAVKTLLGGRGSLSRPGNQAMLKVMGPKLLQLRTNPETSTWAFGREEVLISSDLKTDRVAWKSESSRSHLANMRVQNLLGTMALTNGATREVNRVKKWKGMRS